ncbi:unnamed protein product [Brassica rapa]|uniref:RNase H type-1 domain-containing protein n=1 Tax=Brassica campestris TaxID=3711 RepID=A0A3P5YTE4_BRACM|nr:unnamed protein product [Brassica rapa]VDC71047.1 unnamed protein product [Brassica rapa]
MGPIKESALDLTVADLLTSELKWNKQRIKELLPDLAVQIQCIKPSSTGAEDSFIWHQTTSGIYSTKSESPQTIFDSNRMTCKTDAAWNKEKLAAGLGWVFSGPRLESPIKGSMVESWIGSPLIAEASAIRSALCMGITL